MMGKKFYKNHKSSTKNDENEVIDSSIKIFLNQSKNDF